MVENRLRLRLRNVWLSMCTALFMGFIVVFVKSFYSFMVN